MASFGFSRDIGGILRQVAARSTLKQDQIGTLEPGKLADLVLIDGNPLTDIHDLLKVVTHDPGRRRRVRDASGRISSYTSAILYSATSLAQARSASALL
jgi:hypothetical protein